ncbi:MAG: hypothetical protein WKG06_30390 [Segetibacter sp.]
MKRLSISLLFVSTTLLISAQSTSAIINEREVQRIETILSADNMEGGKFLPPEVKRLLIL